MIFKDRVEAGEKLAEILQIYQNNNTVVYGLPRGGMVVASIIAKKLKAPLSAIIVRKIGHPQNPEYALCAVSLEGSLVCDQKELATVDMEWLEKEIKKELAEAQRRYNLYFSTNLPTTSSSLSDGLRAEGLPTNQTAILVDDGIATGLTIKAAMGEIKQQKPKKIIVAVPVSPEEVSEQLQQEVDEFIALEIPDQFTGSVGSYYQDFPQVTDEEVINLLQQS